MQFKIKDSVFLDLFGGTGQIGLEALSRGAKQIFIVENNKKNIKFIKNNFKKIKDDFNGEIFVIKNDALKFLENTNKKFDIAFLDPPYGSEILELSLKKVSKLINKNGTIITEANVEEKLLENSQEFSLQKKYIYGNISLRFYLI